MSVKAVEVGQRPWETWRPGVRSRSWSGEIDGAQRIRVGEQIFEPGSIGVPAHWHYYEEHILLLSGKMRIVVDGTTKELSAPACVIIPERAIHSFACIGDEPMHILGALGAPIHESFFVDMPDNEAIREYEAGYPGGARRRVHVDPVTRKVEHRGEIKMPSASPA